MCVRACNCASVRWNLTWNLTVQRSPFLARPAESSRQDVIKRGNESALSLYLPWKTCQCCSRGTATFPGPADDGRTACRQFSSSSRVLLSSVSDCRAALPGLPPALWYAGRHRVGRLWAAPWVSAGEFLISNVPISAPLGWAEAGTSEWLTPGCSGTSKPLTHRPLQHCSGVLLRPVLCKLPRPHDHGSVPGCLSVTFQKIALLVFVPEMQRNKSELCFIRI